MSSLTGSVAGMINFEGDGSEVVVTPILESGEKIATIKVDDVTNDIYAPEPTPGSEVDVTQVLQSGTKIATISVDDVETDLYAPTATPATEVVVTPIVQGGTKIATISVDDVETEIQALDEEAKKNADLYGFNNNANLDGGADADEQE